uniref:Replication protein n=1 Tax=Providencia stuartii TaxID=588 RepID=A0AAI9GHV9_PROST|nr:replication protein [Providencia stuartii]
MSNVAYADFGNQRRQERPTVADLDNGYTRIANDLLEAAMSSDLTARQLKVFLAIVRKTYGFSKKLDRITNTQIASMTGIHHTHVCKAKNEMIAMNIVISSGNQIGINKAFNEWKFDISQVSETLAKSANERLAKVANEDKPSQLNTKETLSKEKKENKNTMSEEVRSTDEKSNSEPTKQDPFIEPFEKIFWIAGMRKVGKDKCKTAFKSKFKEWRKETGGSIDDFAKFLADDIQCRLRTQQFGFDKMHPTTYLNGSRWTDEKPELPQSTTQQSSITVSKNGLVFY